jgi:hypothetical protein
MIDLRTASSSGIPATPGQALRLLDIWFSVPENAPAYGVQAEIYANNQLIGSTSLKPLVAGTAQLGDVLIERYNHGTVRQAWSVQPDWKDLLVFLITYRDGKVADRNLTMIHLDASGTAWLLDPPNLNFASIIYAVSDGPALILDLRDAEKAGLSIRPGDKLTLMEIWYDSNADSDLEVHAEAYMSSKGFDSSTFQATQSNVIQKGIHKLDPTPLSWTIPDSKQFLVVTLVRSDNAVTDRLILPLKPEGNPGLIRPP